MREHEGGDKVQRNCCFMFALVVGGLAAAFVAHGQRETSLSLEWTETDVVAVKAGNRIHYDDDVADDTTSSSDTENYSFWGFVSKCDDSTKVLQVLLKIVGVWPFVLLMTLTFGASMTSSLRMSSSKSCSKVEVWPSK